MPKDWRSNSQNISQEHIILKLKYGWLPPCPQVWWSWRNLCLWYCIFLTILINFHDCDYIFVYLLHSQSQHLANRRSLGLADNSLFRALTSLQRTWLCFPVPTQHSSQLFIIPDSGSLISAFDVQWHTYAETLRHK